MVVQDSMYADQVYLSDPWQQYLQVHTAPDSDRTFIFFYIHVENYDKL